MGNHAIGVDLGTTNSCVSVVVNGNPTVVPNQWGDQLHASVVHFPGGDRVIVGNEAKRHVILSPDRTIWSIKRILGRKSFSSEVQKAQAFCAYQIREGENNSIRLEIGGQTFSPEEVSAFVLREMRNLSSVFVQEEIVDAVITVPAYFNDNQRQATLDAGRIAGLNVLRMINEPTAAALAYGFGRELRQRVAIYDLGGGTFDLSVMEIDGDIFEVLGTAGDSYLGGDDFDLRMTQYLADRYKRDHGFDLQPHRQSMQKLREACEEAKKLLSEHPEVLVSIPDIYSDGARSIHLEYMFSQQELNNLVNDLVQRTFKVCDEALGAARLAPRDLDGVILVGGSTRLPIVREAVGYYFGQEPNVSLNPDQVVAMGAAIHAHSLKQSGATYSQASSAHLLDVTPLSLQIATVGGYTEILIERNTPIPIERSRIFTTVRDGQERVNIRVYQGESNREEENVLLGYFDFEGFRIGYRGEARIEVTFSIDASGLVHVTAKDIETGLKQRMTVALSSALSEDEVERLSQRGAEMELV